MTSSVAQPDPAPHKPVAYIVPATHSKRVRSVAADGQEEEADENPWVGMQLKDPFQQTAAGDTAAADTAADGAAAAGNSKEEEEEKKEAAAEDLPKPEAVIKEFAAAKGELEWLMAMLNTLQEGRYLTVGRSERTAGGLQRIADLAVQANSRWRRRATAAAAASAALAEGAAALRVLGQQEDAFYAQVTQLQRYWKVWQEPPSSPYAYSVNLSLAAPADASGSSSGSSSGSNGGSNAAAGPEAAAMVGRGPVETVYILKDPSRNLRVQVPAPKTLGRPTVTFKSQEQPPQVFTGPGAIHALLLQQLRLNAWHMVVDSLDDEICSILNLPAHLKSFSAAVQQWQGRQQQPQQQQQGQVLLPGLPPNGTQPQQQPQQQPPEQPQQRQPQRQQSANFAASGHFTLYASLSSLVLQAVAGAAGTAGEAALLQPQQQQQQQQHQQDAMAVDSPEGVAEGFTLLDVIGDVARPWQQAAAVAAARGDPSSSTAAWATANGHLQGSSGGLHSSNGNSSSSLVPRVCVDPQLLSMRPLALEHLLITQLGHLVASLRHTSEALFMAPIAYAAASRQMRERMRQRQQQHPSSSRAAEDARGSSSTSSTAAAGLGQLGQLKPGSLRFGSQASFLHCFARWLKHAAQRDLLRSLVDEALQGHQGLVARQLSPTHSCVSALQVLRSPLPAASPAAAAAATAEVAALDPAAPQDSAALLQQVRQTQLAVLAASRAAVAPSLLLLLSDAQLVIESTASVGVAAAAAVADTAAQAGAGAGGSAAGGIGTSQVLRQAAGGEGLPPTQSALSVQLQALPRVLQQLLQQL